MESKRRERRKEGREGKEAISIAPLHTNAPCFFLLISRSRAAISEFHRDCCGRSGTLRGSRTHVRTLHFLDPKPTAAPSQLFNNARYQRSGPDASDRVCLTLSSENQTFNSRKIDLFSSPCPFLFVLFLLFPPSFFSIPKDAVLRISYSL